MFDRDNSGFIDKNEFELLAYQCGSNLAALTPKNLNATFARVNVSGNGKVTFDEYVSPSRDLRASSGFLENVSRVCPRWCRFWNWLDSDASNELKADEKGANLSLLRF